MVATSGTTNLGIIDDLAGVAEVCDRRDLWMHVDGAYGGAGLAAPSVRPQFAGHRARRQLHRRSAQVAVRAVRLLRAPVPAPAAGARRAHPARRLPRRRSSRRPSGTRPTTPSTCRGGRAACRSGSRSRCTAPPPTPTRSSPRSRSPGGRRGDPLASRPRAAERARAVGALLPPHRLGPGELRARGARTCCGEGSAFVTPTVHQRRDRDAVCHRQPAHHPHRHQSHPGYHAVNGGLIPLY